MKTLLVLAAGALFAAGTFAQSGVDTARTAQWKRAMTENDELLHTLQVLDRNVLENAKALIHNYKTKRSALAEMARFNSGEIGKGLSASEDYLTRLEKQTALAMDEINIAYFADLHRHYRKAIEEQRALQKELEKASPATQVIVMRAMTIYSEMAQAGKEQIEFNLKAGIQEPEVPTKTK